LYAEEFDDWAALEAHLAQWLEHANGRCHGTTHEAPQTRFAREERRALQPYLSPASLLGPPPVATRTADNTGLIAWQGNKYSVPMAYQCATVGVSCQDGQLQLHDLTSHTLIATHRLCSDKGQIIKNTNHYRDYRQRLAEHEAAIAQCLGEELGARLCQRLKASAPKIYKDQLAGVCKLLGQHPPLPPELLASLVDRPRLTATQLRDYLEAYRCCPERLQREPHRPQAAPALLAAYHALSQPQPQGHGHG
jgi:hypothetical protein